MANTSFWFDQAPDQLRFPKLEKAAAADVVVVGAGLAGVLTAYHLHKAGKKVILLEQNHVATGDTGFTTAFITRVLDADIPKLVQWYGVTKVKAIYQAYAAAQQQLINIIQHEQIECDFVSAPSTWYTDQSVWNIIQQLDDQATWVDGAHPGIRFDNEGSFHVRKFILSLLTKTKLPVYEETMVTNIQVDAKKVLVTTSEGKVATKQVIITTGLPTGFPELQPLFTPQLTYVIAARYATPIAIGAGQYWDSATPYHYWRMLDDSTIMLGGEDNNMTSAHDTLVQWLSQIISGQYTITHRWSGSLFETEDSLPYIMSHPHYHGQVWFACGFGGNGMVGSAVAAQLLSTGTADKNFSTERTGRKIAKPGAQTSIKHWWTWPARITAVLIYLIAVVLPGWIFFQAHGGIGFLEGLDSQTLSSLLFPLVGLYAFTLVWVQFMLGSAMWLWRKVFPKIELFHRTQGIFTLLFALIHPTMIAYGYGLELYFSRNYVAPDLTVYLYFGYFQLIVMCCTVTAALLRRRNFMKKIWRYVHFGNYAVFVSVWIHGWFLGSDVQYSALKYVWIVYAVTAGVAVLLKLYDRFRPAKPVHQTGAWVKAATTAQVVPGKAFLATVGTQQIAWFNFNGKYYAIDNVCSHANGPLCQGSINGAVVTCPWHSSQFDITTGAVLEGPARRPQRSYPVKVEGNSLLAQL